MSTKNAVRQGDVLIVSCSSIPETAVPVDPDAGRIVVAYGEATGHHHSFQHRRGVTLFRDDAAGGTLYLRVDESADLIHQEHSPLTVRPGVHRVSIQRTYRGGLVRRVAD